MSHIQESLRELMGVPLAAREEHGFVHTAAEIESQPELWLKTAELVIEALPELESLCKGKARVLLTGAGSSYFVAASVVTLLRSVFSVAEAIPSTEIVQDPESSFPREDFILVSFARSGDSPEGNAVVELAEELRPGKVTHLAVTCNSSGRLAGLVRGLRKPGFALILPAETNDKSLAMTSSFTSMIVAGYALAYFGKPGEYRSMVGGLSRIAVPLLEDGSRFAYSITRQKFTRIFFIASRPFVAAAHEAHLKVQELSAGALVAKAEDTLGFRHGFMSAVDAESLVVMFFSEDARRRAYEVDLLRELRAKRLGKKIVVVAPREHGAVPISVLADDSLEYGTDVHVTDSVRSPLPVLVGQLLGLYFSLVLGLKPDNPSPSGIINRVVSGVVIYPMQ